MLVAQSRQACSWIDARSFGGVKRALRMMIDFHVNDTQRFENAYYRFVGDITKKICLFAFHLCGTS